MDVMVSQVLKGLQSLHLTLWLLGDVCCGDNGFLPQSVRQWQGNLLSMTKVHHQCWKEWTRRYA